MEGHALLLPGFYTVYEEHLKSGICFPPHSLVVEVLGFWNLPLVQVHPLFARHLVGFINIYQPLDVPTNWGLFRRYHGVR